MRRREVGRGATAAAWLASVIVLAGCESTQVPQEHFYRLSVPLPEARAAAPLSGTLVVQRFMGDGLTTQRPLVYASSESPNDLRQYNYHFWADPPPRMLQELTVEVLRSANVATRVVTPELRVQADYELSGKIKRLDHVLGDAPRVTVELEFTLFRVSDGSLVWWDVFSVDEPAAGPGVAAGTAAMDGALVNIFARLVDNLPEG